MRDAGSKVVNVEWRGVVGSADESLLRKFEY